MFSEGDLKLSEYLDGAFRATWSGGTTPIFLEVSVIVSGFLCPSGRYFLAAFLGAHSWSRGSFLKLTPDISLGLLRDGERCPGRYSSYLLVLLFLDEEGLAGQSSLLSDRVPFFNRVSSYSVEEERSR